jgi:DNA-binding SARP family transcriptional activator/tetratricopeptide (TPR) repeat protein
VEDGEGRDGAWLRRLRTSAGLTQAQLAAQARVGVRTVRDLERGARPRAASLHRLAGAFGLDAAQLDTLVRAAERGDRPRPRDGRAAVRETAADTAEDENEAQLRVDVLGPLRVRHGQSPVAIPSAMQRTLLGLLAVQPDRVVGGEEIIDALWGIDPPRTCRELVRTHASGLRRLLAAPGTPAAAAPLRREQTGYRLRLGPHGSDAARFEDSAARARRAASAGAAQSAWQLYGEALGCWRGPLLAGEGPWRLHHPAVVALTALRSAAAMEWADIGLGLGSYSRTAQTLQPLCAEEPLHEGLAARLMLAWAGEGRQAAALALYGDMRTRLDVGLGVKPGPELREAHLRVLHGRLPLVTRPVGNGRVSAPTEDGAAAVKAPSSAVADVRAVLAVPPAQLPADIVGFTGRTAALRVLDTLLAPAGLGAAPIAVLTGMGGVGKSALAVRWARAGRARFPDGQLFADLRGDGVGRPARPLEVLAGFLGGLGVAPEQVPVREDQASALLRSLLDGRRVLVLLDNAASVEQVRPLLAASPGCATLVTSRVRLGGLVARDGAGLLPVEPLSAAESADLLAQAIGGARARAEREAVAEIARLCAHLPLALRIAAANLAIRPTHRVADHVARLAAGGRLDALAIEGDPQTAVRAAFELSCAALDPRELRVFRLTGLAPGPDVTAEQAAAFAGLAPAEAGACLARLADRNLLTEHALGRFRAHDLVRLYAIELVEGAEDAPSRAAAQERLTAYYLAGTQRASRLLYPHLLSVPDVPGEEPLPGARAEDGIGPVFEHRQAALDWLDTERSGLIAMIVQLADTLATRPALALAERLNGYFVLRADRVYWPTIARIALQAAALDGKAARLSFAWLQCGMATTAAADYDFAFGHFSRSAKAARQAGWGAGEAVALNNLATSLWALGRFDEAVERFGEALALHRLSGRTAGEASTLSNLGAARLELAREQGPEPGRAQLEEAKGLIERARTLDRAIGDRRNESGTTRLLAEVHREIGDHAHALDLARSAVNLAVETRDVRLESAARSTLATLLARTGRPQQALVEHERAQQIARSANAAKQTARALVDLADTYALLGQFEHAALAASDACAMAVRANSAALRRSAERVRARVATVAV